MKIKSWIATILLLSFVVLITPRSLWHSCAHDLVSFHQQKSEGFVFEKKIPACDFCNYSLSLATEPLSFIGFQRQISFYEKPVVITSISIQYFDNQELRRGPPAM
jgi:hypothetical protein